MEPHEWEAQALQVDREDLFGLLQLRFGTVPREMEDAILQIRKPDVLQRLILVAANVPSWAAFLHELRAGEESFRLVGDDFNPLSNSGR